MQVTTATTLVSRYGDGARPVRVLGKNRWEVVKDGQSVVLTTAQELLAELTGHPTGRHWSLDRYFRAGKHAPRVITGGGPIQDNRLLGQSDVLTIFPLMNPSTGIVLLEPLAPPILGLHQPDSAISISRESENLDSWSTRFSSGTSGLIVSGPIGIDLVHRAGEVRKLLFKGFGRRIFSAGYDPDDVLQEVYKGLLARNHGTCPWDPARSSFGHYVYMVCGCVLSNYHRKQKRIGQFEQLGLPSYQNGEYQVRDAADAVCASSSSERDVCLLGEVADDLVDYMLSLGDSQDARLAVDVLPYVVVGTPRADIAQALSTSMATVNRAVSYLRKNARAWYSR